MTRAADLKLTLGRQPKGERLASVVRFPKAVVDGLDRRARREGGHASRNDMIVAACAEYGDYAEGQRPQVVPTVRATPKPRKKSTAAKVRTATPPATKPGARLAKKVARGPKIPKTPVPRQTIRLGDDEEAVG